MFISSTQKKIINILADALFHSGTELAEEIGISRSAVCKQLKQLNDLGIEFCAISGKGYCFENPLELLSESSITKYLTPTSSSLINDLEIHDCINSTNSYLVDKVRNGLSQAEKPYNKSKKGVVCLAEYQTAGRGRRGRDWISPFGSNIYLSVLWNFQNGPAAISGLSLAVGVAVIRALKECGIDDVGLKWPNDVYWQEKKLAGILIEVLGETSGPCTAVIGLGLNIYLPQKQAKLIAQDWVDLSQILQTPSKIRNRLCAVILNHLMPTLAVFENDTLESYLDDWRRYDCMKGKHVKIYRGQQVFTGVVEGINNHGLLLLTDEKGELQTFASGEVSFRKS